ncbi:LacI family DNA-binding transcriptional regulator [Nocardia sp. NPDC051750]|uniref:LacI family DNA-binding transcriptional regulator n=1 Tax=Nocardia sp. NPDC051750 TaxID=3364325 RepID=UPI00378B1C0B
MRQRTSSPTIYDIAQEAGVAPSTVSRAFSRPGRVSAATSAHIHEVAERMGYRTAPRTVGPAKGRTGTLALVVPDVTNPGFFATIRGVEAAAAEAGYLVLLAETQESAMLERKLLDRIVPDVDGVVLVSSRLPDRAVRTVASQCPIVVLNRIVAGMRCIVPDTAVGVRGALRHLAGLGHRSVTYIAGPEASWVDGMRWRSVQDLSAEFGLKVSRLGPCPPTMSGGRDLTTAVLRQSSSAVLAYSDLIAIGLLRGLRGHGMRVPHDMSVIGFDNVVGSDFCSPPLTTVAAPLRAMGAAAFRELHHLVRSESADSRAVVSVPPQLVVRESTGPCG